jgi:hypothetical protein
MYDLYTHIIVFLSIVVALGLSELVSSWGDLLKHRSQTQFYSLHTFWSLFIVLLMIQFWRSVWNYRTVEDWPMAALTALVVQTLTLVLAAKMLSPRVDLNQPADMKIYFYDNTKVFFILAALLMAILAINDVVILHQEILHTENLVRVPAAVICLVAAFQQSERFHTIFAAVAATMLAIFLYFSTTI